MLPMIAIGIMGINTYSWGNQFNIMFIEILLIETLLIIFIIYEFKTANIYKDDDEEEEDYQKLPLIKIDEEPSHVGGGVPKKRRGDDDYEKKL
jgi:hypothetical protein